MFLVPGVPYMLTGLLSATYFCLFLFFRRSLPSSLQKRVSFEAMSADEAMEDGESEGCEVLVVDPPRKAR